MNSSERVKIIRKSLKLSQQKFADGLAISKGYVNAVEAGRTEPSFRFVKALIESYNVSINWVITGNGNIFLNSEESQTENNETTDRNSLMNLLESSLRKAEMQVELSLKAEKQVEAALKEVDDIVGLIKAKEQDLTREIR